MKKVWLSVCCVVLSCVVASAEMTQEDLSFVADLDGTEQRYIKLTPPNLPAEKVDVVFWLHGHGSDRTQVNVYKGRGEIASSLDVCEQNGMLLIFPDYRATTSWMGPAAEADMLQLIDIIKGTYDVGRIFFFGGSMGGSSSLTFAALHPDLVDGVVAFNPLADHMTYSNFQTEIAASFGGTKTEIPEVYRKRSAINHIDELTMPISITVGGVDTTVPPDSARELARLVEAKYPGNVYIDDDAWRGHETDYNASLKAIRRMLCRANGTSYDELYGIGGLVAWWPFGTNGLNDASGHGHSLVAGPDAVIGETVTLAGTSSGNARSGLSVAGIPFSDMDAVTVEVWVRCPAVPSWISMLFELSPNYNNYKGTFVGYYDSSAKCIYSGVSVQPGGYYSMVKSGSDALSEKVGEWRHVVAVYEKGTHPNNLRIYVDGVDVTTSAGNGWTLSTESSVFPDQTLYFGGRNGSASFLGEMDSMKVWGRALSAEEVEFSYSAGRDRDPRVGVFALTIVGDPTEVGTPEPGYGRIFGLAEGATTNCTAPAVVSEGGVTATCLGWELQTYDEATQQWGLTRQSGADDKLACTVTMGTADVRLVWKWDARVVPASKVRTVGRGQVQTSADSVVLGGTVTFTAVPNAGFVFGRWEGADVPAGQESSAAIAVTVNDLSPLTAIFVPDGTGKYETGDYAAQDNLLAHWDGIENAGRGVRDEQAQTWVDLTGKHDGFVFPNGPDYRDGKCYYLGEGTDGKIHAAGIASGEDLARAIAGGKATVEVVYKFNRMVSSAVLFQCADIKNDWGRVFYAYVHQTCALGCVDYLQSTYKILDKDPSPTGDILSYSFCFEDMTIKKNGANTDWSFLKGSITPDYSKVGLAIGSFFNWANGQWVMQSSPAANDANIYAVRIYDRQLTADELARNWAVDQARFVNGNYRLAPTLTIVGDPLAAGTPDPAYGRILGLTDGATTNCTAPASVSAGGVTATCLGWELQTYDEATQQWNLSRQSGTDDKLACTVTMGTADARLVWKWDARVAPKTKVRTVGRGQVQTSADSVVLGGTVTFTAVPNAGFVFGRWEGDDVPAGQENAAAIAVTVNDLSPLTAVFVPDGTGAYEAKDYVAQDHLLAHWDGIENAGRGVRNEQAQTWIDLTGKHDDLVFPNGPVRLNGNCYNPVATSDGKGHGCYLESCADIAHAIYDTDKVATIEIVCDFASAVGGALVTCYDDQGSSGRILEIIDSNVGGNYCIGTANFRMVKWVTYKYFEKDAFGYVRTYALSCQSSAMSILKNGGTVVGNINSGNAVCHPDKAWLSLGFPHTPSYPSGYSGAAATDAKIYAVRIYDRQLTAEELAQNWAVDQARFVQNRYRLSPPKRGLVIFFGQPKN